jgi:hypothetical protein
MTTATSKTITYQINPGVEIRIDESDLQAALKLGHWVAYGGAGQYVLKSSIGTGSTVQLRRFIAERMGLAPGEFMVVRSKSEDLKDFTRENIEVVKRAECVSSANKFSPSDPARIGIVIDANTKEWLEQQPAGMSATVREAIDMLRVSKQSVE